MRWHKRIMFIAAAVLLLGGLTVLAQGDTLSAEQEVTVETSLDGDTWAFDITNNTDSNIQTSVVTAFFLGNTFKGVELNPQKIELSPNEAQRYSVEPQGDYSYDKVKVFLWDDINTMKPAFKDDAVVVSKDMLVPCSGWLISVAAGDSGKLSATMLNAGGMVSEYSFAEEIAFASSQFAENTINTQENKDTILSEFDYMCANKISDKYPVHLVEYKLNSDNEIEKLLLPNSEEDADYSPYVYNLNINGYTGCNIVLNRQFVFDEKVTKLVVPTDVNDTKEYKLTEVDMSDCGVYTIETNMAMGKYNSSKYNILIEYVKPSYVAESFTYDTISDSPYMMISDIQTVKDSEGNEVYKLSGYINDILTEFTTTTTTSVSEVLSMQSDKTYYSVTPLWSASDIFGDSTVISDENKEKYPTIYDALSVGDIVGIQHDGKNANTIIKMVDMQNYISAGTIALVDHRFSSVRDMVTFGSIDSKSVYNDTAMLTLSIPNYTTNLYAFKNEYPVTIYNVETNEIICSDISELTVYDTETNCGDMIYFRKFANDQREIFAVRFGGGSDIAAKQAVPKEVDGNYGWLINAEISEDGLLTAKLLTADSEITDYTFADNITFWGASETDEKVTLDMTDDEAKNTVVSAYETANSGTYSQNLIRYKLNADNEIEELIMAYYTQKYATADPQRVIVYSINMNGITGSSDVLYNRFLINDGITKFIIPKNSEDIDLYETGTVTASDYVTSTGVYTNFYVAEISDDMPSIIIEYTEAISESEDLTYSTADDISHIMVSNVAETTDSSGNKVYVIKGYLGAGEVSYTTTPYTTVSEALFSTAPREYSARKLWSAQDGDENETTIYDAIEKGDIVGIAYNGKTILKMLDIKDYTTESKTIWGNYFAFSATRDAIAMGRVLEAEIVGDNIILTTEYGNVFTYAVDDSIAVYNAQTGEIDTTCNAIDIEKDDVVYLREFKYAKRELYVIKGMTFEE